MSALWSCDDNDQRESKAIQDHEDWQDSYEYAVKIGRRLNKTQAWILQFTEVQYRMIQTQRGSNDIQELPY